MPKKFQGMNSKAVEARARKAATAAAKAEAKKKAEEDEYWKDDDKRSNKKLQRKQAQEQKRLDNVNKKKELGELYKAEEEAMKKYTKPSTSNKVSQADIATNRRKEQELRSQKLEEEKLKKKNISVQNEEVGENINQVLANAKDDGDVEARNIEEAISALSTSEELDRHPERRLKAAYKKYEQEQMPILKASNPNMRLSQLRQMLHKQWQKSPENPLNQSHLSYNAK